MTPAILGQILFGIIFAIGASVTLVAIVVAAGFVLALLLCMVLDTGRALVSAAVLALIFGAGLLWQTAQLLAGVL